MRVGSFYCDSGYADGRPKRQKRDGTYANLRNIRQVRNAFAHAKVPIIFETPEVAAVCSDLQHINIFDPPEEVDSGPKLPARTRFENVCHEIMVRLTSYTGHDVQFKRDDGMTARILRTALPWGIPNTASTIRAVGRFPSFRWTRSRD